MGHWPDRWVDAAAARLKPCIEVARAAWYFFPKSVPHFPHMPMSEADIFALFIASKAIEQYWGTLLQQMLETTFRKLTGQLDQSVRFSFGSLDGVLSFRPFAQDDAELKTFALLTRAVSERRAVKFVSRNRGQVRVQQRHMHPYHIACVISKNLIRGENTGFLRYCIAIPPTTMG